jgi:hypothetical protein
MVHQNLLNSNIVSKYLPNLSVILTKSKLEQLKNTELEILDLKNNQIDISFYKDSLPSNIAWHLYSATYEQTSSNSWRIIELIEKYKEV